MKNFTTFIWLNSLIETLQHIFTKNQTEIIRAILYFDVFKYPLTREELFKNSAINISKEEFYKELEILLKSSFLREESGLILNAERNTQDIAKRIKGNKGAHEIMPTALKYSKKIASFPFVEAVMLSGSLSKNYYDEKSDIDFFVVTKPGRLWICRSLLILRYKLLSSEQKKFWCVNYFISSDNLQIPDVNVFTGTELAYLIPTINYPVYKNILESNKWYKQRFPNKEESKGEYCIENFSSLKKTIFEFFLKGKTGHRVDTFLLNFTLKRWRKKYASMSDEDFNLQFRSRKDVCKRHTHGFQNKILVLWANKTQEFEQKYNVRLSS